MSTTPADVSHLTSCGAGVREDFCCGALLDGRGRHDFERNDCGPLAGRGPELDDDPMRAARRCDEFVLDGRSILVLSGLHADPSVIDPASLAAAGLVTDAPAAADGTVTLAEPDPAALVADVTQTITQDSVRSSAQEFAAAPVALSSGKKSGLSDLEKAGLLVLGGLAVGAIIKNNRAAAADTSVSTMGPQDARVVSNTGDRPVQVGSHYHFFEPNAGLSFDRDTARGMRLDIAAGTAVRFEPGQTREVTLVSLAGMKTIYGFRGDVMGKL